MDSVVQNLIKRTDISTNPRKLKRSGTMGVLPAGRKMSIAQNPKMSLGNTFPLSKVPSISGSSTISSINRRRSSVLAPRGNLNNSTAKSHVSVKNYWRRALDKDNPKKLKLLRLKRKIRIAMRLSLFLRMWWHRHLKSVETMVISDEKLDFVTKIKKQHELQAKGESESSNLFNLAYFKADRQQRIPQEAARILTLLPQYRTDKEIHYLMVALRSHKQVANYPVRMQKLIAKYGILECYDPKRAILRQGHPPQAFYYIFYGTVQVTVAEADGDKVQCLLKKGESFGELAIVSNTDRQSSIITETDVELISISKEAYEEVFMSGGAKRMTDPDHEKFIRSLDFLRGWPIELLDVNPKRFLFTYFQRGAVITKDSSKNDWLYIVKSGSVNVLKRLVETEPTISRRTGEAKQQPKTSSERFESFILNQYEKFCAENQIDHPHAVGTHQHRSLEPTGSNSKRKNSLSAPSKGGSRRTSPSSEEIEAERSQSVHDKWKKSMSSMVKNKPKMSLAQLIKEHVKVTDVNDEEEKNDEHDIGRIFAGPQEFNSQANSTAAPEKRTFLDDLDGRGRKKATLLTMADIHPQFVKVQVLTKGSVFGLSDVVLGTQTSLCLVSNGAECIMINKELYREHMPGALHRYLLKTVSPYPEEADMQSDLLIKINWDAAKRVEINRTITYVKNMRRVATAHLPHLRTVAAP